MKILVAFLAFTLLLTQALPGHALFGVYSDTNMTYTIEDSCLKVPAREAAIRNAIAAWGRWINFTWTEVQTDADMRFECYDEDLIPWSQNTATGTATCHGYFDYCQIQCANNCFLLPSAALKYEAHEIGHGLGLLDGQGGLMFGTVGVDLRDSVWNITMPTQQEIDELTQAYGLPHQELPAGILYLWVDQVGWVLGSSIPEASNPILLAIPVFLMVLVVSRKLRQQQ